MLRRLAWVLAGLSLVCAGLDTVVDAAVQPLLSQDSVAVHGWPFVNAAALGSALLGAVIVSGYPRHPVGWLLSLVGITTSLSLLGEIYGIWVLDEGGPGPEWLGHAGGMVAAVFGGPSALTGLTLVFLLVPDGRLLSARWRYVFLGSATGLILFISGLLLVSPADVGGRAEPNSYGGFTAVLITAGVLLATAGLLLSVVSMVIRLRRSVGDTRQQLRWVIAGAAFVGAGLLILVTDQGLRGNTGDWLTSLPLFVAYFCLPFTIAIAILRYRLYDLDLIINRAVVVALGSLFAAVGYVVIVVAVGAALGGRAHGYWPSVIATAVVALAFQPARRAVVRLADRLAYGERAVPYETLSRFTRRIGDTAEERELLPMVAEAAARALNARAADARLDLADGSTQTATWPLDVAAGQLSPDRSATVQALVADDGGGLGAITVRLGLGRSPRDHEQRLIDDLAGHAAVAFRNARLEAELAADVASLREHNHALEASRRRMFEAGDAERRRLESAIGREVLPILGSMRGSIEGLLAADAPLPVARLGDLVDTATEALEALRELTRGIYPTLLTRSGLGPALAAHFARRGRADLLHLDGSLGNARFPARVESAAYLCCTEAAPDAGAGGSVDVAVTARQLHVVVHRSPNRATSHQVITDRIEALGGTVSIEDGTGLPGFVTLRALLPTEAAPSS